MFNKKPRRNFRQRKEGSSDEEEQDRTVGEENDNEKSSIVVNRPQKLPQNRGISCSSKREAPPSKSDSSDDDEEGEGLEITAKKQNNGGTNKTNAVLSFSVEGNVIIPTAKEIEAARRQRRANLTKKEYIPLDKDEDQVEDDSDELDDHERRIEFAPQPKSVRERIAEQMGDSDDSMSGTDEEQVLWEETQIGKGLKRRPGEQVNNCHLLLLILLILIIILLIVLSSYFLFNLCTLLMKCSIRVHRARQAEFRRMEGDIENARCSAENLEESLLELELKFYRDMTLYTHNLVECLREKIVEINSLELELHTLLSDQMESLSSQRRQKIKEQAEHLQQLSCKLLCLFKKDILLRSKAVFSDVKDDFYEVKKILSRFEEWRRGSYSDSYHNAYISLCLPKLLHPIIRHQLLSWNPLKDTNKSFENMPWFTALETFCHGYGHEELEHTDRQTVTNVIEKTLFPKLTAYVEMIWDPMSLQQTSCLTDLCHRLKEDYSIFEVDRLRTCVDEDIFIPIYPKRYSILDRNKSKTPNTTSMSFHFFILTYFIFNSTGTRIQACKKIAESLPSSWCTGENTLPQLQSFRNYLVEMAHSVCKQQSPKEPITK
uniref:GCF C-terminal domain-containing protein n=1 Tax=Periophthalmus magnuspinnatus TaxID=409849 RepID=A0A3B3ZD31_9GOBI